MTIERRAVVIDAETKDMIIAMHVLLTDENVGLCGQMKRVKADIYGNGKWGLKTQMLLVWFGLAFIAILGTDNPLTNKILKWALR